MTRGICWIVTTAFLALPAYAADQALTADELKTSLTGKTYELTGGIATWKADGSYEFFTTQGVPQTYRGQYEISEGKVCVKFTNGTSRCDKFVRDGDNLILINFRGQRYPLRPK
jgi:hypothetical protein